MKKILIADVSKPGLVMTSEVFKDKIPGSVVLVAKTGQEALELASTQSPDICVIDFDLPDVDGPTLISTMREVYQGPILLTAYPDRIVDEAVSEVLFGFDDAGSWLRKPIKVEELNEKIDQFLIDGRRVSRRFSLEHEALLIGKGAGRGKRAPKVNGRIVNLSVGGACMELDLPIRIKGVEEVTVALNLPDAKNASATPAKATTAKRGKTKTKAPAANAKIKGTIQWLDKKGDRCGIQFGKLSAIQRKGLDAILRASAD